MLVLDTNHLRELAYRSAHGIRLSERLDDSGSDAVTTVVCAQESVRGRMARIAAARRTSDEVDAYARFAEEIGFLSRFTILPWDAEAAERFARFRSMGIRIGTMDLKIACICIEHDVVLLTRNTVDFAGIPGLRFENWLD